MNWYKQAQVYDTSIYEDETGYIRGYKTNSGHYWITHFVINPKYRGKGMARKLAEHLPPKCKLAAHPLYNLDREPKLDQESLTRLYESIGFIKEQGDGTLIMRRD